MIKGVDDNEEEDYLKATGPYRNKPKPRYILIDDEEDNDDDEEKTKKKKKKVKNNE